MDEKAMAELLQPIGELSSAMANVEVPDSVAEAALAEVLKSAGQEDAAAEEERAAREARAARATARSLALEALRRARLAAQLDAQGHNVRTAIKCYERALADFAEALNGDAIPEAGRPRTLEAMNAYLDRCRQLRLELDRPDVSTDAADGSQRRVVLLAMARAGYALLARGVAARKAGLATDASWRRFVFFADAADCFVTYLKTLEAKQQPDTHPPATVTKALTDLLPELEELATKLQQT